MSRVKRGVTKRARHKKMRCADHPGAKSTCVCAPSFPGYILKNSKYDVI